MGMVSKSLVVKRAARAVVEGLEQRQMFVATPAGYESFETVTIETYNNGSTTTEPPAIVASTKKLDAGTTYLFIASGEFILGGGGGQTYVGDAEYANYNSWNGNKYDVQPNINSPDYGIAFRSLKTAGGNLTRAEGQKWGQFSSNHEYEIPVEGTGEIFEFQYVDDHYPSNSGDLLVEIFKPKEHDKACGCPNDNTGAKQNPVRYNDGAMYLEQTALSSRGFGLPINIGHTFTNDVSGAQQGLMGPGVGVKSLPVLAEGSTADELKIVDGTAEMGYFDKVGSNWVARNESLDKLTYNSTTDEFTLQNPGGDQQIYYGFGSGIDTRLSGKFKQATSTGGQTTDVIRDSTTKQVQRIERADGQKRERFVYSYIPETNTVTESRGNISSVQQDQSSNGGGSWQSVRNVSYDYYDYEASTLSTGYTITEGALAGRLRSMTLRDGNSSGNIIDQQLTRYWKKQLLALGGLTSSGTTATISLPGHDYVTGDSIVVEGADQAPYNGTFTVTSVTSGTLSYSLGSATASTAGGTVLVRNANGYLGEVKQFFAADAFDRMKGDGISSPLTATDSQVKAYATNYFQYDSQRRATKEIVQGKGCSACTGGFGSYSFAYTDRTAVGYNSWAAKTVETLPDGNQNIVYTNNRAQVLLKSFKNVTTGAEWVTFNRYDANGRRILHATPSASNLVSGSRYNESYDDLVNYDGTTGSATYLNASTGLIELYEFGTSTSATSTTGGDATGYLKSTSLKQGTSGTAVPQMARTYYEITGGGSTIYPVASESRYRNTDGTGTQTNTYAYTFQTGTTQMATRTATMPAVTTSQNGSNATITEKTYFDNAGRSIWVVDPDGFITYNTYDEKTGAMTQQIQDVNPSSVSSPPVTGPTRSSSLPAALNLTTMMSLDVLGRVSKMTDPNGNVTWTVYNDANQERRIYRGWNAQTGTTTGPIEVVREDRARKYAERLTMSATPSVSGSAGSYVPTGTESISNLQSLSRDIVNDASQVIYRDIYTTANLTYSTNQTIGTGGSDYLRTQFGYDDRGRQARVKRPDGTWSHTVYDGLSRVASTWTGTINTGWTQTDPSGGGASGNNMVKVTENTYDNGGIGDSNLTESTQLANTTTTYSTKYAYDFRNRMTGMRGTDKIASAYTFDNLGEQPTVETYADANTNFSIDSGELRSKSASGYDERGQVYKTTTYEVDPATGTSPGTVRDSLSMLYWYDGRGNQIKVQDAAGRIDKQFYDGAGRVYRTATSADAAEVSSGNYADASSLNNDLVIEMNESWLDAGGRTRISTAWKRDSEEISTINGIPSASHYDHSSMAYWYDAADRVIAVADYGRDGAENGGTSSNQIVWNSNGHYYKDVNGNGTPDVIEGAQNAAPGFSNFSTPSDTVYDWVSTAYQYDAAGRPQVVTDNANRKTRTEYDLAGRTLKVIENYVDGVASETETDTDRITATVYDGFGRRQKLVAYNPKGSGNGVESQTTTFLYGSDIDRGWNTATLYPDSTSTYSLDSSGKASVSGTDHIAVTFDRLGRQVTSTDQRGVVHSYTYDFAGRLASDSIGTGTLPTDVDGLVRTIAYSYDDISRVEKVSSKNVSGITVNEIQYLYDGWGNINKTYQAHDGAVNTSSTPFTTYTYEDGATAGVAKYVRLFEVRYPKNDGANVGTFRPEYDSGSGRDTGIALNRVVRWRSGSLSQLVQYKYLGVDTLVDQILHPQISGGLVMNGGSKSNDYSGFDRYYRRSRMQWQKTNGTLQFEQRYYAYDRMGNRLSADSYGSGNGVNGGGAANWDETYTYDGLNRLMTYKRGTFSSGTIASPKFQQSWTLDTLGNWRGFTQTNNDTTLLPGVGTFTQSRTNNAVNEITGITGGGYAGTGYDAAGNMTAGAKTGDVATQLHLLYDGWNRQSGYDANGDGDLFDAGDYRYSYDGTGRRISKFQDTANDATSNAGTSEEYFYNENYQLLEVKLGTTAAGVKTVNNNPKERYLWDLTYIDAPAMVEYDNNLDGTRDQRLWPTFDANYNVTALLTDQGVTVERYAYTPYGERIIINGDQNYANTANDPDGAEWTVDTNGSDFGFVTGFQGLRFDGESGSWYQRARYNSPMLGFAQRDPLLDQYQDGMHLYVFARQNPIDVVDPSGLYGEEVHLHETQEQASAAGFSEDDARTIADADQGMDDAFHEAVKNVITSGLTAGLANLVPGHHDRYNHHFPGAGPVIPFVPQRPVLEGNTNPAIRAMIRQAVRSCDLLELGKTLHAVQDSFAHGGSHTDAEGKWIRNADGSIKRSAPDLGGHPRGRPLHGPLEGRSSPGILDKGNTLVDNPVNDPPRHEAARLLVARVLRQFREHCKAKACGTAIGDDA